MNETRRELIVAFIVFSIAMATVLSIFGYGSQVVSSYSMSGVVVASHCSGWFGSHCWLSQPGGPDEYILLSNGTTIFVPQACPSAPVGSSVNIDFQQSRWFGIRYVMDVGFGYLVCM
ncbi:MAG: hypothetical protein JRN68_06635 [Nitrososphaerota archaeon]|nr:hypothetical protein [Nitrososphaerota archaeon]